MPKATVSFAFVKPPPSKKVQFSTMIGDTFAAAIVAMLPSVFVGKDFTISFTSPSVEYDKVVMDVSDAIFVSNDVYSSIIKQGGGKFFGKPIPPGGIRRDDNKPWVIEKQHGQTVFRTALFSKHAGKYLFPALELETAIEVSMDDFLRALTGYVVWKVMFTSMLTMINTIDKKFRFWRRIESIRITKFDISYTPRRTRVLGMPSSFRIQFPT